MRVGVVGCGYVFDHYLSTWSNHPDLELVGVADQDKKRLQSVASAYGLQPRSTR